MQLLTGILLVVVAEFDGASLNHIKIAFKLAIATAIFVIAFLNRKKETVSNPVLGSIGALTLINVVIAVVVPGVV